MYKPNSYRQNPFCGEDYEPEKTPTQQAKALQKDFDEILQGAKQHEPGRFFVSALTSEQQSLLSGIKKELVELVDTYPTDLNLYNLCKKGSVLYDCDLPMIERNISNVKALQMSETGTRKKIDKIYEEANKINFGNDSSGCGGCSPFSTKPRMLYEDA